MPDLKFPWPGCAQDRFMKATNKYVALVSGKGLGKSTVLLWKMLSLALINKGHPGLLVSQQYSDFQSNLIPKLKPILEQCAIPYRIKMNVKEIELCGVGIIRCRSAEAPEDINGFEAAYLACDEAALCSDEALVNATARVRGIYPRSQMIFTSTPEGTGGWIWKSFVDKPVPDSLLIGGSTDENVENVGQDYLDLLTATHSPKQLRAYRYGDFVDWSGDMVYETFERATHVTDVWPIALSFGKFDLMLLSRNDPIYIGCDFGSAYGCWVVAQKHRIGNKIYLKIIDEIYKTSTNTADMAEEFVKRYASKSQMVIVTGDATGGHQRSSVASVTDYQIIERTLRNEFARVSLQYPSHNKHVVDRVNNMLQAFKGDDRFQLKIHSRCINLIEDLKHVTYKLDGSRDLNKNKDDGKWTHMTDAMSYLLMDQDLSTPLRR